MPFVLREGFTEGGSDLSAAGRAPAAAAFEVFVDAVLLQEPVTLAGVTGEHFQLQIERAGGVENELGSCGRANRFWCDASIVSRMPALSCVCWTCEKIKRLR